MATYRTSWAGGGTSGSANRTLSVTTPTIGDLLVIVCGASGNTNAAPTCSDNQGGTYYLVGTALKNTSADILSVFVRQQLIANTNTHTVTVATGSNTAAEIVGITYSGIPNVGQQAVRSSGFQANQAGGGTPAPALNQNALTGNPTISGVFSGDVAGSVAVPNASWTERQDAAQASPTTGVEVNTRDSGFTSTTITFGGTTSTAFASFAIELNADLNFNESLGSIPTIKQDKSLWPPLVFTLGSLLCTTLAPITPPIFSGASELTETLHHPAKSYYLNPDTSTGSYPLVRPYNTETTRQPYYQGQKKWDRLFSETSQGAYALQNAPVVVPFVNPPIPMVDWNNKLNPTPLRLVSGQKYTPVTVNLGSKSLSNTIKDSRRWNLSETSQGTPDTLQAVIVVPPVTNNPQERSQQPYWYFVDTSKGTAKTLTEDNQLPVFNVPQYQVDKVRPVVDTTQKQPITLQAIIPPAPIVNVPHFLPTKFWWQPSDTSASVAKVLYSDKQFPVFNLAYTAPDRIRPVVDTTKAYLKTLYTDQVPPVKNPQIFPPDRIRPVVDTQGNKNSVIFTTVIQVPPFVNLPYSDVIYKKYQHQDTSQSSFGIFYPVVVLPIPPGQALQLAPIQKQNFGGAYSETSQSIPPAYQIPPTTPSATYCVDFGVSRFGLGFGKGVSDLNYNSSGTETCTVSDDEEGTVSHANWYLCEGGTPDWDVRLMVPFTGDVSTDTSTYANSVTTSNPQYFAGEFNVSDGISTHYALYGYTANFGRTGNEAFTLECFITPNRANHSSQCPVLTYTLEDDTTITYRLCIGASVTVNPISFIIGTGVPVDTGATVSQSSKIHLAVVRPAGSGTQTVRIYVNGVQVYTEAESTAPISTRGRIIVGSSSTGSARSYFIDDVRMTYGERYTGTSFTPPTSPL